MDLLHPHSQTSDHYSELVVTVHQNLAVPSPSESTLRALYISFLALRPSPSAYLLIFLHKPSSTVLFNGVLFVRTAKEQYDV